MYRSAYRLVMVVAMVVAGGATVSACTHHQVPAGAPTTAATMEPTIVTSTMHSRRFTLIVDVEPAVVGQNEIQMYATMPDGHDADIVDWRVTATNPARGLGPVQVRVLPITNGHAVGAVDLPAAGTWRISVTVRTKDSEEDVVSADIRIT